MRIQNNIKSTIDSMRNEKKEGANRASFTEVMTHSKQKLHHQQLSELMSRIEAKGELLAQKKTVENVRDYKKLVKQFVEEVVSYGLDLQEKQGFQSNGRPKLYKVVEEVDQKLVELTNQIMHEEKEGLEVLAIVGEIKGLLINLYT